MDKTKVLVTTLVALVVVMAFILTYVFLVQPRIDGYMVQGYNIGIEETVVSIAQQASQCQTVPLNLGVDEQGNEQVMELIWVECLTQETEGAQQISQGDIETAEIIEGQEIE